MPVKLEILDPVGTQLFDAITAGVRVGPRDVRMCNNGSHHYRDTKKILTRTLTFFISLVTSFCSLEHAQQKLVFILNSNHIKGHCTCIHLKKNTQTNYFIMLLTIKVHLPQFLFSSAFHISRPLGGIRQL